MRILDLTQPMEEGMPVYPGDPLFRSRAAAEHETDGYRIAEISFGSHCGTHIDLPFHFFEDGENLDAFPLETFAVRTAALDLTAELEKFRYGSLPPVILPELLQRYAPVFESAEGVILKTGWSQHWNSPDFETAFPSFLPETADWLAEQPIRLLGLETPSLSALANYSAEEGPIPLTLRRQSEANDLLLLCADTESHRILLGRTPPVLIVENLLCPDGLPLVRPEETHLSPDRFFTLLAFPLRIRGGEASPLRAAALLAGPDPGPKT